jgi:tyrosyl-DNA phosphodiesterase 2
MSTKMAHVPKDPKAQPYYGFHKGRWVHSDNIPPPATLRQPSAVKLITWNIDMSTPGESARMEAALQHLQQLISPTPSSLPVVIFLQEMTMDKLTVIKDTPWVQEKFYMTDIQDDLWLGYFGTTTLVDRSLVVRNVFRVGFVSQYGRDGLFVDVVVSVPDGNGERDAKIRLCNTHLESLIVNPTTLRSDQVADCTAQLRAPGIHGGVLAGDFNAIQPFDRTLHSDNGLTDAYLALGGKEDGEEGHTWGYQSRKGEMERYPPRRMDKVVFCGGIWVEGLERVGIGAEVEEKQKRDMRDEAGVLGEEELYWITDHYGLMCTVKATAGEGQAAAVEE